jgi:iron complex transport system permease protein
MTTLLLSGIAIGALCSAVTTLVLAMGTERWDLGLKVVQWLMGSFEGRSWDHLLPAIGPIGLALVLCAWLRLDLDALQLGPETAQSLGVDLIRTRRVAMAAVGILVGVATAMTGVIGFVGLIVPHVARRWVGAGHRALLPVCMALGALVLLAVDVVARAVPDYALPPGAITSLLGAPFFLWLLHHRGLEGV